MLRGLLQRVFRGSWLRKPESRREGFPWSWAQLFVDWGLISLICYSKSVQTAKRKAAFTRCLSLAKRASQPNRQF